MISITNQTNLATGRSQWMGFIFLMAFLFTAGPIQRLSAQCVERNDKKTALKFSNESRFELTFFVDDDEDGVVVPSKSISREVRVEPGEHLLRARAIVRGKSFWVWDINEVPEGQACTWTIEDPRRAATAVNFRFRSAVNAETKRNNLGKKRRQ